MSTPQSDGTVNGFVIEEGVPLPDSGGRRKGGVTDTIRSLKPGQSFLITKYQSAQTPCCLAYQVSKGNGAKYVTRKVDGGVRIWRVS